MSYLVLARKYRSPGFDDVIGQEHVGQTLKRAIESNRIAHAFLFCGTRGVGKTSMARILAKALNCEKAKSPTPTPCNECNSCIAIARGDDIDVIEIDAASNRGIDEVRRIIENARFTPARSRFKIYIIDEVHAMTKDAFNALLKVLEEPPSHVKFVLATTEPEKVLPTILSRCQRYDFRNISTHEIAEHLADICKKEKIKADPQALLLIAKAGAGSMRDALSLLDRLLSFGEKNLSVEMIEQLLGMPKSQLIFDLVQSIGEGDVKQTLQSVNSQILGGMSPDTLIAGLIDHFRNLLVILSCGADSSLVEVPGIAVEELTKQANQFDAVSLSQNIAILEELRRSLRSTQAGRALLDATLVRIALSKQFARVDELLERVNGEVSATGSATVAPALKKNDEPLAAPAPAPVVQRTETPIANVAPVSPDDLDAVWKTLLQRLSADSKTLPAMLHGAKLVGVEDGTAIVQFAFDHDAVMKRFDRNGKKDTIRDILGTLLQKEVGLRFELEQAPQDEAHEQAAGAVPVRRSPAPASIPAPEPAPARITPELKESLRSDPLVAAVIEHLGGEIVKVE